MAPKKKGGKKAQDDWEADLGEAADPIAQATKDAKVDEAAQDDGDDDQGGGLLAALRKNRSKKQKKGKVVEDFVEGEDPTAEDGDAPAVDLSSKAPIEASMDDEDVFGQPMKKEKPGKGKQKEEEAAEDNDDDERGANGKLLTKKEKEKLKKEREKQRKKEQVS
jgi:translation initiation factor 5B